MKPNYHANRGVKTDQVVRIITDEVVRNKSVSTALDQFLEYESTNPRFHMTKKT